MNHSVAVWAVLAVLVGCVSGPEESEYYEAYLQLESELSRVEAQLDSTLVRISQLESAIEAAETELAGAQTSALEAEVMIARDPPSAEYHAQETQRRIQLARTRLEGSPR